MLFRSDFVLLVCSERYSEKFNQKLPQNDGTNQGQGVIWESVMIRGELVELRGKNQKFHAVLFGDEDRKRVPLALRNTFYSFKDNEIDQLLGDHNRLKNSSTYEALYRLLTNQPKKVMVPIGDIQNLALQKLDPLKPKESVRRDAPSEIGRAHV